MVRIVENDYKQRVYMEDSSLKNNDNNLKRRYIRAVISVVIICFMVIIGYGFLARATKRDDSDFKYRPFFEEDTDYDVMFFGSSHMRNAIFPMQLWNDYGITSYNCACNGQSIPATLYTSEVLFKYHKPKIAVLDVFHVGSWGQGYYYSGNVHEAIDSFPFNLDKVDIVKNIYPDDIHMQIELLMPFSIYHNRWNEFNRTMIKQGIGIDISKNKEKGAESKIGIKKPVEVETVLGIEEERMGLQYVSEFIDQCREYGIQPLIINIPYKAGENNLEWTEAAMKLAEEKNAMAVNFQNMDTIDFDIDVFDESSHLNPSGARKVTEALGKYLIYNFELEDKRNNSAYGNWNLDYEEYYNYLVENINNYDDYKITLMLLNNSNFKAELTYTEDYKPDQIERKLLKNLGENIEVIKAKSDSINENIDADIKLTIYNTKNGKEMINKYYNVNKDIKLINKTLM